MDKVRKAKLVYGYIRIEISFLDVPLDISDLVNDFLTFGDKWDAAFTSDFIDINSNENTITQEDDRSHSAYGYCIIDKKSGAHTWRLKIVNGTGPFGYFAHIGIVKNDHHMLAKTHQSSSFESRWDVQNR